MKYFYLLIIGTLLTGCSSPEDKARALLGEARSMYNSGRYDVSSQAALDTCIGDFTAAEAKLGEIFTKYPAAAVANEMGTQLLKSEIQIKLSECKRLKKVLSGQ